MIGLLVHNRNPVVRFCSADRGFLPPAPARPRARRPAHSRSAVQAGPVLDRRWSFADMQRVKLEDQATPEPESVPAGSTKSEIFIMMPLDIIAVGEQKEGEEASFIHSASHDAKLLDKQLQTLRDAGADGIMMDVWWGIVERKGPGIYDFSAYMELFKKARRLGLKVQAVMSFHAGGGNVGDGSTDIPLPPWVMEAGEAEGDEIFYTDKRGGRDHECISLGCDHEPVLAGRTPLQVYADFVAQFAADCQAADLWGSTVREICLGTGPCGELRYPSYQEKDNKWSFMGETLGGDGPLTIRRGIPGIGEFQCYDKYMMADLKRAAEAMGEPEWGDPPRDGAGSYDFAPWETEFLALTKDAGWQLPYGKFFMEWYSQKLVQHCGDCLDAVIPVMEEAARRQNASKPVDIAVKVAGIHWYYRSRSHAAEMTAGYYNYLGRCGYTPIAKTLKQRGAGLSFTCIEMSDTENPDLRHCSPEAAEKYGAGAELVKQVIHVAEENGVMLLAENALEGGLYNADALARMRTNSEHFSRITLLRLNRSMFVPSAMRDTGLRVTQPLEGFLKFFDKH